MDKAEKNLILKAAAGDAAAFEQLMAPYEKRLYTLCLRIAERREDAMDCAQEAMIRIWRSLPKYRFEASVTTWCYRITVNTCLDLLRRNRTKKDVSLDALTDSGFAPADDLHAHSNPEAFFESDARRRALEEGILSLPEDMRAVLVLRDIQGFTYEEISEVLTLPVGTVKSRMNRAREKLRQFLMENSRNMELFGNSSVHTNEGRQQL